MNDNKGGGAGENCQKFDEVISSYYVNDPIGSMKG